MSFDLADYERNYAAQYREHGFETVMVAARRQRVLESLGDSAGKRVLEIGCGMEPAVASLTRSWSRVVVEPAASFASAARAQLAGQPRSEVVEGFFEEVANAAPASGPFDTVIVSSLLHEVADPRRLLSAVRSVCAAGALVHVNVPNARSFHRILAVEMGLIADVFEPSETERKFQRTTRFDMASLVAFVEEHGFAVRAFGSYFVKPFTHDQMQRARQAGIVDEAMLRGLYRMARHLPDLGAELYVDLSPA